MARDISVSIAVQGEKEFNQALKSAQSAVKVLASELKASEAAFDENADAQAYFANRSRIINSQIEQEKEIIESLKRAITEAGDKFGDTSEKTDKYRIALNRSQAEMSKLERSLRETQREAEELGRDSTRVGRQIEDGLGDAADDVSDKLDRMTEMLEKDLGEIGGAVKFSAAKELGEMVTGALDGMVSFVDETKETRLALSYLELSAEKAGLDFQAVKDLVVETTGITGELDGAFEGMNNLIGAGFDTRELTEAVGLLGGAVISFPETFKFEELASSMRETIKTGSATGQYAELLETLGVDMEEFNKAMARATTEEERQQIALSLLNEHGLEDLTKNMQDQKESTVALNEAQTKYSIALAGLGTALEPAATAWTKFKTSFVNDAAEIINVFNELYNETNEKLGEGQNFWEIFKISELPGDVVEGWKKEADLELTIYKGLLVAAGTWAKNSVNSFFDSMGFDKLFEINPNVKKARMELPTWEDTWTGVDPATKETANKMVEDLTTEIETAAEGKSGGFLLKLFGIGTAVAEEAGDAVQDVSTEIEEAAKGEEENMEAIGENWISEMSNGISEKSDVAIDAAMSLWQYIKEILTQQITIPAPKLQKGNYDGAATLTGGGNGLGGSSHVELVAQIDRTTVARATSGELNTLFGESAERAERYG